MPLSKHGFGGAVHFVHTEVCCTQIRVRVKDAGFVGKGAIGEGNHRLRALIAVRLAFSLRQVILGVRQPLKDFFIKIHTISANAGLRSNAQEMSNGDIEHQ